MVTQQQSPNSPPLIDIKQPLNFFFSAPTSPRHSFSSNPFLTNTGNFSDDPKTISDDEDFEFEFSGQLDIMSRPSLSTADELFDGGIIRPLQPPTVIISGFEFKPSKSPVSTKQSIRKSSDKNPFEDEIPLKNNDQNRGRSMDFSNSRSNSRKGKTRSLSPFRVSEFVANEKTETNPNQSSKLGSKKWKLKDFLLFRSVSEGRVSSGKDPLRKYFNLSFMKKSDDEEMKNLGGFRSLLMVDGSISRRRGQVSAHEMHYTANRAVSGELKKKTSLAYKHGLLGCLGFNPSLHDMPKAFGSFDRS